MQLGYTSSHPQQNIFQTQTSFVQEEMSQGPSEKIEAIESKNEANSTNNSSNSTNSSSEF